MDALLKKMASRNATRLPYKELAQWEVGKAVIENAVNTWESLGFFDGIEDEEKVCELAIAFDNITHDFLAEDERLNYIKTIYEINWNEDVMLGNNELEFGWFDFTVVVYPLLRRIICGVKSINGTDEESIDNFDYDKFLDYLEELSFLAVDFTGCDDDFDAEATFCDIIGLAITNKFKREE